MAAGDRLKHKVGLVTGAARGIGEGIARAMVLQGASIYLGDVNAEYLDEVAKDIGAIPVLLDVTNEESWAAAAARIRGDHGRLDILVNNAGVEIVKPIDKLSVADLRKVMSVNLEGPMIGCRTMQPLLSAAGKGGKYSSVINISSVAALVGLRNMSAYSVSKAAVAHLSKELAVEWAELGHAIRVNSIFPGCIRTPMLEHSVQGWIREGIVEERVAWENMENLSPFKKIGEVNDIAMGAIFLASDESKFVTGTSLVIDGGWVAR